MTAAASRLLTPLEVAERCALSPKAVYRAIERGELPAARLCSRLRVRDDDVEAWISARRVTPRSVDYRPRPTTRPATNGLRALLAETQRRTG